MKITVKPNILICAACLGLLSACGPETNSRYGDKHWDPQSTWEATQLIRQPELSIVYNETGTDPNTWDGYVSIDFTDLVQRDEGGENTALLSYSVGTNEPLALDNGMLQNAAGAEWSKFYYDSTTNTDWRLLLSEPEDYTFYLDLAVRQPNGTLRIYNFTWEDVVLPGPLTRNNFWDNRMNALVTDNCISCHNNDGNDAHTAFDLDTNNLLGDFVDEVLETTDDGQSLPGWPFNSEHTGVGNAAQIVDDARDDFNTFVQKVRENGTTADFTLTTVETPDIMEIDPYN